MSARLPLERIRVAVVVTSVCACLILHAAGFNFDQLQQTAAKRFGPQAAAAIRDWQAALGDAMSSAEMEKLRFINAYINARVVFADDQKTWGVNDYWATPLESLARAQGDCEDYVIAKYFSLRHLGLPAAKLRLTYVRARIGGPSGVNQAHMVLAYYPAPDAEPLVLDNLVGEIRPASRRPDLSPVFSFNSDGVWMAGESPGGVAGGASELTRWRDLLSRMQTEGFDLN
jgi:predicted transglutaminase-like cysteine proteinase